MIKFLFMLTLVALGAAIFLWIGCSDSPSTTVASEESEPDISQYFPLKAGNSLQYVETNNATGDTSYFWYTVGDAVNIGGCVIYPWLRKNVDYSFVVDTGYLCVEGNALYYFDSDYDTPEKLLETPLEVGNSWRRFEASQFQIEGNNLIDYVIDNQQIKNYDEGYSGEYGYGGDDPDIYTGNGAAKNFPTFGFNYLEISAIEDIKLDNGNSFTNCLKVENGSGTGSNYYWYAPQVGLVRYIIGVDSQTSPDGDIAGEIVLGVLR